MSLVIKNYFKNYSKEQLSKLSAEKIFEIHHKAWVKDAMECMNRKRFIEIFDKNKSSDGVLLSTIIEHYGNQYHNIAKAAVEKKYAKFYTIDFVEELLECGEFDELGSFAKDTKDSAALDSCFEIIKNDYLKEHAIN